MLVYGFRGQLYDDNAPLYLQATDGWVLNRISRQWLVGSTLAAQMAAEGYVPTVSTIAGAVAEVGVPSIDWQDTNEAQEFWGSPPGGQDWGDSGAVWPTAGTGGQTNDPVKGPFMADGVEFWINTDNCMIGFDVDQDPAADIWQTGQEVCENPELSDQLKMAISAQSVACGCPALICMTPTGKVQKAYQQETLQNG